MNFVQEFSRFIANGYYEGVTDTDFLSVVIRDVVFLRIEKPLYFHYCKKFHQFDLRIRNKMSNFLTFSPSHFKIEKKYTLVDPLNSSIQESPYRIVSNHLSGIENTVKLKEKLQILRDMNNLIPKTISNYNKNGNYYYY